MCILKDGGDNKPLRYHPSTLSFYDVNSGYTVWDKEWMKVINLHLCFPRHDESVPRGAIRAPLILKIKNKKIAFVSKS